MSAEQVDGAREGDRWIHAHGRFAPDLPYDLSEDKRETERDQRHFYMRPALQRPQYSMLKRQTGETQRQGDDDESRPEPQNVGDAVPNVRAEHVQRAV
ncbi:hypothetical protein D3C87_1572130 [compost metagenome]